MKQFLFCKVSGKNSWTINGVLTKKAVEYYCFDDCIMTLVFTVKLIRSALIKYCATHFIGCDGGKKKIKFCMEEKFFLSYQIKTYQQCRLPNIIELSILFALNSCMSTPTGDTKSAYDWDNSRSVDQAEVVCQFTANSPSANSN